MTSISVGIDPNLAGRCWIPAPVLGTLVTVLHVEDDPNDVLLLRIAFRRANLPVLLQDVQDGQAAVQYLSGSGIYADRLRFPFPGLVLSDLKMPRLDGFGLLAWARSQPGMRGLPIIVLSSSDQPEDVSRAMALGADHYLVKASGYHAVINAVQEYLETAGNSAAATLAKRAEPKPRTGHLGY